MEEFHLKLHNDLTHLRNSVATVKSRKKFLSQQILNQFSSSDTELCRRVLGDTSDIFNFNTDLVTKALTRNIKIAEKITGNILSFKSSVIEPLEKNDLRKIYNIDGKIEEIKYVLEFITEFKDGDGEKEKNEFVKEIRKLTFHPTFPVLERMSEAMMKEHCIETLMSSLYMFHYLKEEQNKVIRTLVQYEEIDIEMVDDGSFIIHVIISSTTRFYIKVELIYNIYNSNFFHKNSINADEELLIRYSQHKYISILKGEKNLHLEDILDFIESIFEVPDESGVSDDGHEENTEETNDDREK